MSLCNNFVRDQLSYVENFRWKLNDIVMENNLQIRINDVVQALKSHQGQNFNQSAFAYQHAVEGSKDNLDLERDWAYE